MSQKLEDYYFFEKTYSYDVECPYEGAGADGIEDAEVVSGDIAFSADIIWISASEKYEIEWTWEDLARVFDNVNGDAPASESEFISDVLSFLYDKGIDEDDITY